MTIPSTKLLSQVGPEPFTFPYAVTCHKPRNKGTLPAFINGKFEESCPVAYRYLDLEIELIEYGSGRDS